MQHRNQVNLPPVVYLIAMLALSVATLSLTYPAIRLGIVWYSADNPTTDVDATLKTGEKLTGGKLQRTWGGLILTDATGASYTAEAIETMVLYLISMVLWLILFALYRGQTRPVD